MREEIILPDLVAGELAVYERKLDLARNLHLDIAGVLRTFVSQMQPLDTVKYDLVSGLELRRDLPHSDSEGQQ